MPYVIALVVLVAASVGFAVFQGTQAPDNFSDSETAVQEEVAIEAPTPEVVVIDTMSHEELEHESEDEDEDEEEDDDDIYIPAEPAIKPDPTPVITTPVVTEPVVTEPTPPTPVASLYDYANGSYSSYVTYHTPDGTYGLDVTLTISNDVVTASNVVYSKGGQNDSYSRRFDRAYENYVIGKDIDSISLSRVGGSSLTTRAFNNALAEIKTQAEV